jgi:hypothetical protein
MPMGATLALREDDKRFTRRIDGAKRRSSVPHGHFAPLPGTLVGFNRFYTGKNRGCPGIGGGKSLGDRGAEVKFFPHEV